MGNNFNVVVVEKLVNTSRPMRRSVVLMKEHSCNLFGPFFTHVQSFIHPVGGCCTFLRNLGTYFI
jgi:hypothetical protein